MSKAKELLKEYNQIQEAMPNLPKGVKLPKDTIKDLVSSGIGSKTKWKKIDNLTPANIKPTKAFIGVSPKGFVVGNPKWGETKSNKFDVVFVKGKDVSILYKGSYRDIGSVKGVKDAVLAHTSLADTDFTWYTAEAKERMQTYRSKGAVLKFKPEVVFELDKVGEWLAKLLPKAKAKVVKAFSDDIDVLFSSLEKAMKDPGTVERYGSDFRAAVDKLDNRNNGLRNFTDYVSDAFGRRFGEPEKLSHKNIVTMKAQLDRVISGLDRW